MRFGLAAAAAAAIITFISIACTGAGGTTIAAIAPIARVGAGGTTTTITATAIAPIEGVAGTAGPAFAIELGPFVIDLTGDAEPVFAALLQETILRALVRRRAADAPAGDAPGALGVKAEIVVAVLVGAAVRANAVTGADAAIAADPIDILRRHAVGDHAPRRSDREAGLARLPAAKEPVVAVLPGRTVDETLPALVAGSGAAGQIVANVLAVAVYVGAIFAIEVAQALLAAHDGADERPAAIGVGFAVRSVVHLKVLARSHGWAAGKAVAALFGRSAGLQMRDASLGLSTGTGPHGRCRCCQQDKTADDA